VQPTLDTSLDISCDPQNLDQCNIGYQAYISAIPSSHLTQHTRERQFASHTPGTTCSKTPSVKRVPLGVILTRHISHVSYAEPAAGSIAAQVQLVRREVYHGGELPRMRSRNAVSRTSAGRRASMRSWKRGRGTVALGRVQCVNARLSIYSLT
jgi:hypothetical protein